MNSNAHFEYVRHKSHTSNIVSRTVYYGGPYMQCTTIFVNARKYFAMHNNILSVHYNIFSVHNNIFSVRKNIFSAVHNNISQCTTIFSQCTDIFFDEPIFFSKCGYICRHFHFENYSLNT